MPQQPVVNGQIIELDKALNSCLDLNNKVIKFKQQKNNEQVYEGIGSDNRTYYLEIQKPIMTKVIVVKNNK
jgi:hypothetical protein